jgi:ABC-type multidrug transport system fused ATPase/permease subunit
VVDVDDPGPDEAQPKFRIRDLKKKSDAGVPILNGINVDIPKGVIVGIIGPSGSGKSTMLRALNRLWEPPLGTVFLDGRDICKLDVLSLRRKVGMLFQLPALFEGTLRRLLPPLSTLGDWPVTKCFNSFLHDQLLN